MITAYKLQKNNLLVTINEGITDVNSNAFDKEINDIVTKYQTQITNLTINTIIFDFTKVDKLSSEGLKIIYKFAQWFKNLTFIISNANKTIQDAFMFVGLSKFIKLEENFTLPEPIEPTIIKVEVNVKPVEKDIIEPVAIPIIKKKLKQEGPKKTEPSKKSTTKTAKTTKKSSTTKKKTTPKK